MRAAWTLGCTVALTLAMAGCAVAPTQNLRIDEALGAHALLRDAGGSALAPAEAQRADEALERALAAWQSREDPALVDHLAYVARQRARIAAETARRIAAERGLAGSHRLTSSAAR